VYARRRHVWSVPPTLVILHLGISQLLFHCSLLGCELATGDEGGTHLLYWITFYARSAQNTWLSNLAIYFVMLVRCRYKTLTPIPMWIMYAFGWGFPMLLALGGYLVGGNESDSIIASYHALCWYRNLDQLYPDLVLTVLYFLTFVPTFMLTRKAAQLGPESVTGHHEEVLLDGQSDSSLDSSGQLHSERELDELIQVSYSGRVKAVLAIGFLRLCYLLVLQYQMSLRVSPDGSFKVQMMFAVLLVDGGGGFTALVFLWRSPLFCGMMAAMGDSYRSFFSKMKVEGGQEVPWMGRPDDNSFASWGSATQPISSRHSWSQNTEKQQRQEEDQYVRVARSADQIHEDGYFPDDPLPR